MKIIFRIFIGLVLGLLLLDGVLFAFTDDASAAEFEASVGKTWFGHQENGYWYQDGFAHDLHMTSPSVGIGVTDAVGGWFRYHAGYRYLGHVSTAAWCMGSDALYAKWRQTGKQPLQLGMFYGDGAVNMLYLTGGPEFHSGRWVFGLEGGFTVYRPTWTEQGVGFQTAPGARLMTYEWNYSPKIMTGGMIGISAGYDKTDIVLSLQDIDGHDAVQAVYHGLAANLSLRQRF